MYQYLLSGEVCIAATKSHVLSHFDLPCIITCVISENIKILYFLPNWVGSVTNLKATCD